MISTSGRYASYPEALDLSADLSRFYNKTSHAGLQNHIMNCYANALLQVMFFTPALRNLALQHTASSCFDEMCLLCELGFLFDMLSKADGAPCHASNLLKIVSYHPQGMSYDE